MAVKAIRMTLADLKERVEVKLLCVLEEKDDVSLDGLSKAELLRIGLWAETMMYEASDNPCRARYAPKVLRDRLPKDHYLQTWRKPKR